jgi:hypothetical protein
MRRRRPGVARRSLVQFDLSQPFCYWPAVVAYYWLQTPAGSVTLRVIYTVRSNTPDAVLDYTMDWSEWLDGDTIASSIWTAESGITINSSSNTTTVATVWLSGGTAGESYRVTNQITTAAARTDDRSLFITVKNL